MFHKEVRGKDDRNVRNAGSRFIDQSENTIKFPIITRSGRRDFGRQWYPELNQPTNLLSMNSGDTQHSFFLELFASTVISINNTSSLSTDNLIIPREPPTAVTDSEALR